MIEHEAALIHQKGRIGQLLQADRGTTGQGVVGGQQYIQRLVAKGLEGKRRITGGQAAAQFQFAAEHRLFDIEATALQ